MDGLAGAIMLLFLWLDREVLPAVRSCVIMTKSPNNLVLGNAFVKSFLNEGLSTRYYVNSI